MERFGTGRGGWSFINRLTWKDLEEGGGGGGDRRRVSSLF